MAACAVRHLFPSKWYAFNDPPAPWTAYMQSTFGAPANCSQHYYYAPQDLRERTHILFQSVRACVRVCAHALITQPSRLMKNMLNIIMIWDNLICILCGPPFRNIEARNLDVRPCVPWWSSATGNVAKTANVLHFGDRVYAYACAPSPRKIGVRPCTYTTGCIVCL